MLGSEDQEQQLQNCQYAEKRRHYEHKLIELSGNESHHFVVSVASFLLCLPEARCLDTDVEVQFRGRFNGHDISPGLI